MESISYKTLNKFIFFVLFLCCYSLNGLATPMKRAIHIGIFGQNTTPHPMQVSSSEELYLHYLIFQPLIHLNQNWEWQCGICNTLPTKENNGIKEVKGKLHVNFQIRNDAKWDDGTPITGFDAQQSFRVGKSINTRIVSPETYTDIEKIIIDASDPKQFTLIFKNNRYSHSYLRGFRLVPWHKERKKWIDSKDKYNDYFKQSSYNTPMQTKGLYTGPYSISEQQHNSVHLVKNPHYHKPLKYDKIQLSYFQDLQDLYKAFKDKRIDIIAEPNLYLNEQIHLDRLLNSNKIIFETSKSESSILYDQLAFNLRNPNIFQKSVRLAMYLAIDREETKRLLNNKVIIMQEEPFVSWYPTQTKAKENVDQAKNILKGAGWMLGKDGFRYKNGIKLKMEVLTNESRHYAKPLLESLQRQWKTIGLDLVIKYEEDQVFFGRSIPKANYRALLFYTIEQPYGFIPYSRMISSQIPTAANGYEGQNITSWTKKDVDSMLEVLKTSFEKDERSKLLNQIRKRLLEEKPFLIMFAQKRVIYKQPGLPEILIPGHQFPSSLYLNTNN